MRHLPTSDDIAFWILCGVAATFVLVKAWPWIRRMVSTGDAIGGLPELIAKVDTLTETADQTQASVASLAEQVDTIHHEVTHNDGSSIKDAVKRTEDAVQRIENRQNADAQIVAAVIETQSDHEKAMVRLHERVDGKADK